jgi:hypothetical protein
MSLTSSAPRRFELKSLSPHGFHRVVYYEWGDADNPRVLVCAHGLTRCGRDFDTLAKSLQDHYRVICPDVAGRGDQVHINLISATNEVQKTTPTAILNAYWSFIIWPVLFGFPLIEANRNAPGRAMHSSRMDAPSSAIISFSSSACPKLVA